MSQATIKAYRKWVIAAGIYNILYALPLAIPEYYTRSLRMYDDLNKRFRLGGADVTAPQEAVSQFFVNLSGLLLTMLGFNLIYAAMDLKHRSGMPVINGITRLISVGLIAYYSSSKNLSRIILVFSTLDLLFAGVFLYYTSRLRGLSPTRWFK